MSIFNTHTKEPFTKVMRLIPDQGIFLKRIESINRGEMEPDEEYVVLVDETDREIGIEN